MEKKILIFEPDVDIREIVSFVLQREGYSITSVGKEEEVFPAVKELKPDVILLDIIQPTEEGLNVCRMLRLDPKTRHVPVIVYSTHAKAKKVIREDCADDVLSKPFDLYELVETVKTHLEN